VKIYGVCHMTSRFVQRSRPEYKTRSVRKMSSFRGRGLNQDFIGFFGIHSLFIATDRSETEILEWAGHRVFPCGSISWDTYSVSECVCLLIYMWNTSYYRTHTNEPNTSESARSRGGWPAKTTRCVLFNHTKVNQRQLFRNCDRGT